MQAPALSTPSRPALLERALLFTLCCSLIADYCGGNLPFTDAWAFFVLLTMYLGTAAQQQRPVAVAFLFGAVTLISDIIFLAVVRFARRRAPALEGSGFLPSPAPLPSPHPALPLFAARR